MGIFAMITVAFQVSLIISFGSAFQWDTITAPISNDGCKSKCGNVSVPFPFGMGHSNCFLDENFEVTCNDSITPPKLVLKNSQLEVLNIPVNPENNYDYNEVTVKGPIGFFNCGNHSNATRPPGLNLTGTPFSFSQKNVFVAKSCGVSANLMSRSGKVFSQIGCISDCSPRVGNKSVFNAKYACNGTDCCQTPIPAILDSFDITFDSESESKDGEECKYAFVSSLDDWNDKKLPWKGFSVNRHQGYAPLLLDWNLDNPSYYHQFELHPYCQTNYRSAISMVVLCKCEYGLRGNPYLVNGCTQDINECEKKGRCPSGSTCVNTHGDFHCSYKRKFLIIGFGSSSGALFLLFALWRTYKCIKQRKETKRKRNFFEQNGGLILQQQLSSNEGNIEKTKLFTSVELEKATDRFSVDRILGKGGQGTVYKGMLEDGKIVAVKKSTTVDESKLSEFINEVVILSQINHRNVVQLLGCCLETEVPILVYEYIANGTLSDYIHEQNEEFPFTWKTRIRIASEIAGALSYLHSAASFPIYHRDIKSTNILLDEKYKAKVADFGTSRTISLEQTHLTTLVYGTFGYLDPEYFQSSQFTEKSDVYSFGVVLAELLTGQKAICSIRPEEGRNLATFFIMSMEANALFDILDPQVLEDGPREEIEIMGSIALSCLSFHGRNRPTMKDVAMDLEAIQKNEMRSKIYSHSSNNKIRDEVQSFSTDFIEPWDVTFATTASPVDRSLLLQELPLLSIAR